MDTLPSSDAGLTVERYGEAKGFDVAKLARWGVTTEPNPYNGEPAVAFRYYDQDGHLIRTKYRGQTGTVWDPQAGVPLSPYGLQWLAKVPASRYALLVEGESDCHAGWTHKILALGLPGASTWRSEWAELLEDRPVYVWREPDTGGTRMCEAVAADLPHAKVIQPIGVKDLADLHLEAGEHFDAEFQALMDVALPLRDVVIPAPRHRPNIRVWRESPKRSPFDRDDMEKAKAVPLDQLMRRLGFDIKRRGSEWVMACPFHEDRHPSLRLNSAKGLWCCDPCGAGGDGIAFMRRLRGLSFTDAVRAVGA